MWNLQHHFETNQKRKFWGDSQRRVPISMALKCKGYAAELYSIKHIKIPIFQRILRERQLWNKEIDACRNILLFGWKI